MSLRPPTCRRNSGVVWARGPPWVSEWGPWPPVVWLGTRSVGASAATARPEKRYKCPHSQSQWSSGGMTIGWSKTHVS